MESLRTASPAAEITLISKEPELPYYRLNLTRYLAGEIGDRDLPIHPASWYEEQKVRLLLGAEASAINLNDRVVELHGGEKLPFDKLLLAAGAHPFVPPFPGTDREGVTSLRTVEDARGILAACRAGAKCVCIGGGLLGLETAGGLARQGAEVTLLESHGWLLPRQLNSGPEKSSTLCRRHRHQAANQSPDARDCRQWAGPGGAVGRRRNDFCRSGGVGHGHPVEQPVGAAGRPGGEPGRGGGQSARHVPPRCLCGRRRGRASGAGLWNLGAVAIPGQHRRAEHGRRRHRVRRHSAIEHPEVLGLDLFSIGQIDPEDASFRTFDREADGRYFRFVCRDNRLVGAVLLGDTKLAAAVKKAAESGSDYAELLSQCPSAPTRQ